MTDPADQVAAKIAEIRQRAAYSAIAALDPAAPGAHARDSAADVPVLLSLADAVQELAGEWDGKAAAIDAMSERSAARGGDPDRLMQLGARAQAHEDCARALREVISRALLGQEAADG